MKIFKILLAFAFLLSGCATETLVRHEEGEKVGSKINLKRTPEPTKYEASIGKHDDNFHSTLEVKIFRNDPVKEEWEDEYSKVGVYETHCKGWMLKGVSTKIWEDSEYCEFNVGRFIWGHVFVFGFLYDLYIPFQPYNEQIAFTSKKPEEGTITKSEAGIVDVQTPLTASVKLTVNNISSSSHLSNGIARFEFKDLRLKPNNLPSDAQVLIEFNGERVDLTQEFSAFVEVEKGKQLALQEKRERELAEKEVATETENDSFHDYFKNKKTWHNEMEMTGMPCEEIRYPGWTVIKRLDKNHYEAFEDEMHGHLHAIIETTKTELLSAGRLVGIVVKRRGYRQMALENGFEGSVQLFTECSDKQVQKRARLHTLKTKEDEEVRSRVCKDGVTEYESNGCIRQCSIPASQGFCGIRSRN